MNDEELKRFLESMNQLTRSTDEYYEKIQQNLSVYNTMLAVGDKENAARAKSEAIINKTNQSYEAQLKAMGLVKNSLGEWERLNAQLTSAQRKKIAEEQHITDRQKAREDMAAKVQSMLADKTGTALKALSAFGDGLNKTVFDSTKGQSKYGEALDGAGDSIQKLSILFPGFGKAIVFATGSLFKLAGAAMKQQEGLNKAYETLSEIGAVDVSGIEGMFKNLQNAGFTVKELDKFGNILKTATPNLATLGTTAADGVKVFSESLGKIKNTGVEKELRQLGFTSESIAKTFADYQGLMGRQGFLQGKSTAEVAKQSAEYAKTLDQLAKLTGESRDELQKRMDADANDIKFRLKLQEVDEETRKRLQKASVLIGDFGEDTASGFREMVANNGKVVGDASAKLMISTGNAAKQIAEDLNSGKISSTEAARQMAEAKAKQVERFREIGKLDADIMKELGLTAKDMDAINKYRGKTQAEVERMDRDQELQAKGELDRQRAAEVTRQMTERNMEQSKDRFINMIGKAIVPAFEKLEKIINAVGKGLAEFTKFITFGKVDFTDLFKSSDDIVKDLSVTTSELDKTNKQIVEINNAQERYRIKQEEYLKKNEEIDALEIQLSKESNAEKKKELEATLTQARKDRALLKADADQARQDARKGGSQLKKLEEDKARLEKQKVDQEKRLEEAGGKVAIEKVSPEQQKLQDEATKLAEEQAKINDLIADKSKILYEDVMKKLGYQEEDLKNEEKKKEFDKKYADAKKEYYDRQKAIDIRLIEIGKEDARLKKEEIDKASKKSEAPAATAGAGGATAISQDSKKNLQGISAAMKKRGITDESYIKATLGNVMKESGGVAKSENLDYSKTSNERIKSIFGSRASGMSDAQLSETKKDPQKMAEMMYGGEWGKKNLGNTETGDAWNFRGRGYIQLTGRSNYAQASKAIFGDDRLVKDPDLVNNPDVAAEVTAWYMERNKSKMQKDLGLGEGPLSQADANLLATSQVAGKDIRKSSDYLKGTMDKVSGYADKIDKDILQAAGGGLFSGPKTGYPVMLHGDEMVVPIPDMRALESLTKTSLGDAGENPDKIFKKTMWNMAKTDRLSEPSMDNPMMAPPLMDNKKIDIPTPNISELIKVADATKKEETTPTATQPVNTAVDNSAYDRLVALQMELIDVMTTKLDQLDSRLAKSNDIQENILTYSAA